MIISIHAEKEFEKKTHKGKFNITKRKNSLQARNRSKFTQFDK